MQVPSTDYITLGHNPSPACHTSWALRSHSAGEHQITSVTQHCSTAICPPATPKPCPCINRGGVSVQEPMEKLSALYRWGFDCCSSGSKTLERPPDLTWIHTQTHLALIWNYKSGQVLLETEPRFVWKACKPQPSFQQAAFSIWLWVSWQIFCRALVCDSFSFVAGLLCCGVVCHA